MQQRRRGLMVLALGAAMLVLAGCVRGCPSSRPPIHLNPNMDQQPKYRAQSESKFFYDGSTMRRPVPGTVARGELRDDPAYYTGRDAEGNLVTRMPVEVDEALLARGEQRYTIYCAPCHDARGRGQGILFQRGNVATASFHDPRLVEETDGYIFDVITIGYGMMKSYRYPVPVRDRWAIVAHVRRLQGKLEVTSSTVAQAR